ncbi:ubiquitin carboxyl-terminal hydrolase CYLD-like [Tachypleus tridentatus]|uniref:ubiquitin carboxyl-terminal hydrolase CYLD-like n=1 Tax=Tachypleus tridentatus TaxID=6853 RepID=UPI003FCEF99A
MAEELQQARMNHKPNKRKYLLLVDYCARNSTLEVTRRNVNSGDKGPGTENEVFLPQGTIFEEVNSNEVKDGTSRHRLFLKSMDHDSITVSCIPSEVEELTLQEADILLPIFPPQDRTKVYFDNRWLSEASLITVGSKVAVQLSDGSDPVLGVVQYRGCVNELGPGTIFGVELLEHPDRGLCDGTVKGKCYFHCRGQSGIFVPISRLHLFLHSHKQTRSRELKELVTSRQHNSTSTTVSEVSVHSSTSKPDPVPLEAVCADGTPPPPLQLNNRVVWISDSGPEYGWVRWLGKLPDVGSDWMVGVEFDNPIGTGTGKYNDHELFHTKLSHASLVPIIGLMKAEDFLVDSNSDPKPNEDKAKIIQTPGVQSDVISKNESPVVSGENFTTGARAKTKSLSSQQANECPVTSCSNTSTYFPASPGEKRNKTCGTVNKVKLSVEKTKESSRQGSFGDRSNVTISGLKGTKTNSPSSRRKDIKLSSNMYSPESEQPESFYVVPDECTPGAYGSSSSVNPLYEMLSEKGNGYQNGHISCEEAMVHKKVEKRTSRNNVYCTCNVLEEHLHEHDKNTVQSNNSSDLEVGSAVEVLVNGVPRYGIIRWIGIVSEQQDNRKLVAGIEMEEEGLGCTDGTFNRQRYFTCPPNKAFFVFLNQCRKDSRFIESERTAAFGSIECPSIIEDVPPLSSPEELKMMCGKNHGIQGHHNSCYLDATLFAMFSCTSIFDSLLHRPPKPTDIAEYSQVQRVLKEKIVNPLRANWYVRADRVMHLRKLLEELGSVRGLTSEEKDPEEFLNSLLQQILKAEPFLKLSSGQESFFYQLFVEKDENLVLPSVQQLFDQSFLTSDIKLQEVPPCLLIQMPRFGKQFKMYPRIIPSQYLDITDILADSPRECSICGHLAEFECKDCFGQFGEGLYSVAFCQKCIEKCHGNKKRSRHKTTKLNIPPEYNMLKDHTHVPRIYMELFAVVCIETSHYVCFVKCGSGPDAPWCFFDSMADRKGEQNGYNIPEVVPFPDLRWWLSEEGMEFLMSNKDDKCLPEIARRLLCDAYMCMYQSPDVMMYR